MPRSAQMRKFAERDSVYGEINRPAATRENPWPFPPTPASSTCYSNRSKNSISHRCFYLTKVRKGDEDPNDSQSEFSIVNPALLAKPGSRAACDAGPEVTES